MSRTNNSYLFPARGKAVTALYAKKVTGCVECGGTALYRVGARGYCKKHKASANRAELQRQRAGDIHAHRSGTDITAAIDEGTD